MTDGLGSNYTLGQSVIVIDEGDTGYISAMWEDDNGDVALTVTAFGAEYSPVYEHEIQAVKENK